MRGIIGACWLAQNQGAPDGLKPMVEWLPGLIQGYYRLSGRHEVSGRALQATLARLGLEEFAEWGEPE